MIYDVKSRCLKLLDDGGGVDPWKSTTLDPLLVSFVSGEPEEVEDELCDLEALSEEAHRCPKSTLASRRHCHQKQITGVWS
jgi:hypothetical protein